MRTAVGQAGRVELYCGTPGEWCRHPAAEASSYFDRLWRTGLSAHSATVDRYVLHLRTAYHADGGGAHPRADRGGDEAMGEAVDGAAGGAADGGGAASGALSRREAKKARRAAMRAAAERVAADDR